MTDVNCFYATQVSFLREPSIVIGRRSHLPKTIGQGRMTIVQQISHCQTVSSYYSGYTFLHYESPFPACDYIPYVRSGLYQLVIRVKRIRVCALHCVRAVTSSSYCIRSFVHRRGHHALRKSSFVSPAHGPRWLFLLSRHCKAISAAANQKPFCNSFTRKIQRF